VPQPRGWDFDQLTTYLVDGVSNATAISGEQRHDIPAAALFRHVRTDTAVHVDGIYQKATDIPTDVQVNTRNPVTLVRPLPEWGQIIQAGRRGDYRSSPPTFWLRTTDQSRLARAT
jgi:hypothetical protein